MAKKSTILYNLAKKVPSFGVGVIAAIAEARAITAVTIGRYGVSVKNGSSVSILLFTHFSDNGLMIA